MIYTRQEHYLFLEEELQAQTDEYQHKLDSSASYLLNDREELFVSQFVKFENGEMILKFNNSRGIPRKGEYLYCFTTPKTLHNFREWKNLTYGELIKNKGYSTELVCIWQYPLRDDPQYCLVGFRGVDLEFAEHLEGHSGAFLILGPNVPPYQYIGNLQKIIRYNNNETIQQLIEGNTENKPFTPQSFAHNISITDFIIKQLSLTNSIIIQGPPGTGKTTQIAKLCDYFCRQGLSVLVTALTNRALIEVASKEELQQLLIDGAIYKTKMSVDEAKELPALQNIKQLAAEQGKLMLSTFYVTSGEAYNVGNIPPFDIVIMDEASQALLAMFAAVKLLGKKHIFVGDPNQLSPVIAINADRIARRNYSFYVDGIVSINSLGTIPSYRLTTSYRLPQRAATYTGLFYNNTLLSAQKKSLRFHFDELPLEFNNMLNQNGGPVWIKTDLPLGDKKPKQALALATMFASAFLSVKEQLHISVLSCYVETTKALQKTIYQTIGNHTNLLVDTVSRIQGLTTDITIYVIPNTGYSFSLNKRLFNVATSRATRHTIIISDTNILTSNCTLLDSDVRNFLNKLNSEQSVYIATNQDKVAIEAGVESNDVQTNTSTLIEEAKQLPAFEENVIADNPNFIETEVSKIGVKVVGFIDLEKIQSKKRKTPSTKAVYIIDTNVFVDCPDICNKLGKDNQIILSAKVVDELDKLKITLSDEEKENVNKALKNLNRAIDQPNVTFEVANTQLLPPDFNRKSPDNMILSVALKYEVSNPILLTSDNGLQIKAKGLKINTISLKDYLKKK